MKNIIMVCLVMASVSTLTIGNTNSPYILWAKDYVPSLANTNIAFTLNPTVTNGLITKMPQVSSYCAVVTNYSRKKMLVGIKGNDYIEPDCRNWKYVTYSNTDYYETETVTKKNMLKYDVDGIVGETCIKSEILSNKRREVKQALTIVTNDWVKAEDQRWFEHTNITRLTSMTSITNYINPPYYEFYTNQDGIFIK